MKLFYSVVTEECRGKGLKLSFSIILKYGSKNVSSVYNIDEFAEARFKFVSVNDNIQAFLSLKKHGSAKDSKVKVDVRSADLNYSQQWVCTEHWIDWQDMGLKPCVTRIDNYLVVIPVNITVTEEKCHITENIYEDEQFTDFHLGTASDGRVAVHRVHLAAHSEVFKMMLSHEWDEKTEGCIQIEGVTLQTLKHLKQYMYLGTLPDEGLRPLLLLARCYLIDNLKNECISKLAQTATSEDMENLLNFAIDNKITELILAVLQLTPGTVVHGAYLLNKKKPACEQKNGK